MGIEGPGTINGQGKAFAGPYKARPYLMRFYDTRLAGAALETVDGGTLERVVVSGITMNGVGAPIFVRLGGRRGGCGPTGCAIAGLPEAPVEDVTLENLRLGFAGGGTKQQAERMPEEFPDKYPQYAMFGPLPAYGFFVRHTRDVQFRHVRVAAKTADARPALKAEDAPGLRAENLE